MNTQTPEENTKTGGTLIERLFHAGAHFGFTKSRRHPTVVPYLYGNKQGTDIFDLEKTSTLLNEATDALTAAGAAGKTILFVGTKEEISTLVHNAAEATAMPYVVNRWIGGMLTNFAEIKKRIARLNELTEQFESGELERKYTKKERVMIGREHDKLTFNFGGMKTLEKLPDMLIVVDPRHSNIAIKEANELNIPIVGVTSSDANLRELTHPVLVNDALQSSVSLVLDEFVKSINAGTSARAQKSEENKAAAETKRADA